MKRTPTFLLEAAVVVSMASLLAGDIFARGGFGGGGGGARGGGGGARPAVSRPAAPSRPAPRPAARPAPSRPAPRPSAPNLGGGGSINRPNVSRPPISSPAVSRPAINQPIANRPATRPAVTPPSINRPSPGGNPAVSLPGGGLKPSTRPGTGAIAGGNRPTTLPGVTNPGINRPDVSLPSGGNRPTTRPSVPDLAGGGNRPGINRPGGGINVPGKGARPSPGDLGDFLGLDKPMRPETLPGLVGPGGTRPGGGLPTRPETLPGLVGPGGNRPGGDLPSRPGFDRPGLDRPGINRPGFDRPGSDRPNFGLDRPGLGDRGPINIGEINVGNNNVINNRPSWVNMNNNQFNTINNRWQSQIGGLNNWAGRNPARLAYWNGWGNGVRNHWHYHNHGWFGPNWWTGHRHSWCGWHYGYGFNRYPWNYWWRVPTYAACARWFTWSAPAAVWSQPVYYDYGTGGNVVYTDNSVLINNEPVASTSEFAQSAMTLATVAPPPSEEAAEKVEWMPLGTFGISTSAKEVEPTRVIQLAVSKEGIISGTLYNTQTDQAYSVQGQVDKNTQRVAFRIGESDKIVVETGIYNLTQQEAPVLVHFGTDKVENWLLVRMESPEAEPATGTPRSGG